MSKQNTMDQLGEFIKSNIESHFDGLLEKTYKNITMKEAEINSIIKFQDEMEALGKELPYEFEPENLIEEKRNEVDNNKKEIKEELDLILSEVDKDEVEKLVKKTKYTTSKPLDGGTFALSNKREVSSRIKEKTAETLVGLSPEEIVEIIQESDDPKISRFLNIYKPKNVSKGIKKWIDQHITDVMLNSRLKEQYEEMKEDFYLEETILHIAERWVNTYLSINKNEDIDQEQQSKMVDNLNTMFLEEITII